MKKLFSLVCLVVLLGVSANVMGQGTNGTGINPSVGSTHTYSVLVPTGATVTYAWKVTENGSFDEAGATGTDLLSAGTVVSGSSAANSIALTWKNPDIANSKIYYVHVLVTADGCTNRKVMAVQPKNNFQLDIANVDVDGVSRIDAFTECAPNVTSTAWTGTPGANAVTVANATVFTYDYGVNTFYYKVTASGIDVAQTDWKPVFTVASTSAGTVTAFYGSTIAAATTALTIGNNTGITISAANTFFIKVVVTNTTDEGTTARTVTVNLDKDNSKDENDNVAISTNKDVLTQTIKARPNTGAITTD